MKISEFIKPFQTTQDALSVNVVTGPNSTIYFQAVLGYEIPTDIGSIEVTSAKIEVLSPECETVLILNDENECLTYRYNAFDVNGNSLCDFCVTTSVKPNLLWIAKQIVEQADIRKLGMLEFVAETSKGEYFDSDVCDEEPIKEIIKLGCKLIHNKNSNT